MSIFLAFLRYNNYVKDFTIILSFYPSLPPQDDHVLAHFPVATACNHIYARQERVISVDYLVGGFGSFRHLTDFTYLLTPISNWGGNWLSPLSDPPHKSIQHAETMPFTPDDKTVCLLYIDARRFFLQWLQRGCYDGIKLQSYKVSGRKQNYQWIKS